MICCCGFHLLGTQVAIGRQIFPDEYSRWVRVPAMKICGNGSLENRSCDDIFRAQGLASGKYDTESSKP